MAKSKRAYVRTCGLVAAITTVILVCASCAHKDADDVTLDVACDAKTFVFEGPTHADDRPAYGASFVVQGVIYPGGTFNQHGSTSGFNMDGEPEFPDLVIGTWTCRGWFIGDGAHTTTGPFVVTHQIYDLDMNNPGAKTLTSDGIELADQGVPFDRAVTGGTGVYVDAGGQVSQEFIDSNSTGFQNFVFRFSPITVGH